HTFIEDPFPTFDTGMSATLKNELNPADDNIIKYVRGECLETGATGDSACGSTVSPTYRDRRLTVGGGSANGNVWKLGDIISSTPKVFANTPLNTYHIDYGDSTYYSYITSDPYKQRSSVAFVGANDGVLHAFRVGYLKDTGLLAGVKALFQNFFGDTATNRLGEEVLGYIPFNSFPYLKYLASTGYCHLYFNDLSVRLIDASVGGAPTDARTASSWKTILIGGMRFGGACEGGTPAPPIANGGFSSYYAIDITDPESPVPLWEFSDQEMGYATTFPAIVRTGSKGTNGYWYVAFGSGSEQLPKSGIDLARDSAGYIYLLDLTTGDLVKKIQLDHNAVIGDLLAIDADKDYRSEAIYFGTAYTNPTWKGKLVGIAIPDQDLTAAWTPAVKYLFSDNYPFTASPDSAKDADNNVWVYIGSGKYNSDVDEQDASGQIFLGLKDKSTGITYPLSTASGMDDRTSFTTTGTVTGTRQECLYDSATNSFGFKAIVTSISPSSTAPAASNNGWYLALSTSPTSERVITRPLAVGGLVDFLTYKPDSDACSYGGESFLYAVGYTNGVAPETVAIMDPGATSAISGNVTVAKGVRLGPGAPPTGEAIIIPPPKEGQETLKKKIQIATGVIIEAENKPVTSVISKIVHWLRK
ncbi:MAG TPA: PilC/PilY family type IV pilus protein, partial [Candidatus Manganitrophaceae bacterium]|nr:PilC/PilY family type IV pilus protein [Candidatus Manganitrophaceae bacterium]